MKRICFALFILIVTSLVAYGCNGANKGPNVASDDMAPNTSATSNSANITTNNNTSLSANNLTTSNNTTISINNRGEVVSGMITPDQAIEKAKKYVPPQAAPHSHITVNKEVLLGLPREVWRVTFDGANVSQTELEAVGWLKDSRVRVTFGLQDPPGIFQKIIIDLDAHTGDAAQMSATSTPVTADQALLIAEKFIPPQAVHRSTIKENLDLNSILPRWNVVFTGANVSRAELEALGWRQGPNVIFGVEIPPGTFKNIQIDVDLRTGDILYMSANSLPPL